MSDLLSIYRVEDRAGNGPFCTGLIHTYADAAGAAHFCGIEHDWPDSYYAARNARADMDNLNPNALRHIKFGCLSMGDLRYWLPSPCGIEALHALGVVVAFYKAAPGSVEWGTRQVAFDSTESERLWTIPLTALAHVKAP